MMVCVRFVQCHGTKCAPAITFGPRRNFEECSERDQLDPFHYQNFDRQLLSCSSTAAYTEPAPGAISRHPEGRPIFTSVTDYDGSK